MELECLVDFAGTAERRRRKADQFSKDPRNACAAELLTKYAAEAQGLEGSESHNSLVEAFEAAYGGPDEYNAGPDETVSEYLRMVGFGYAPPSADAFLKDLAASLRP